MHAGQPSNLAMPEVFSRRARVALTDAGAALLRLLPAERAHHLALSFLQKPFCKPFLPGSAEQLSSVAGVDLSCELPGFGRLAHPLGLAAGFDKNAQAITGLRELGFAFLELGTVTPLPQQGNPRPRLFRQPEQRALINRMGFNNEGCARVAARLGSLPSFATPCPLGVNIGKNKDTRLDAALSDYISAATAFSGLAAYLVINLSSPNTPGLRSLATPAFVRALATALTPIWKSPSQAQQPLAGVWIKLDPDMPKAVLQELVASIAGQGFAGIILSNTHRVSWPESGGQSGHPLALLATACLEWAFEVHKGALPMMASGGVLSGSDIFQKVIRGAAAVQIYTALIYRGPWVVKKLLDELQQELRLRQIESLEAARGLYYQDSKLEVTPSQ